MNSKTQTKNSEEVNLLIAFCDLTNFTRMANKKTSLEVFDYLSSIYEITGEIIEPAKGRVIKFIGDAVLITFGENDVDEGIIALKKLKETIDNYNIEHKIDSHLIVKAHFGKVLAGLMGTSNNKNYDIIGAEVNLTASLKSNGFAISVEAFRKLNSETRKLFKKHTPPITYINIADSHRF